MVETHRVANVDFEVQEAHHLGYYRLYWSSRLGQPRNPGLAGQRIVGLKGETLQLSVSGSLMDSTCVNMDRHVPNQMAV